MTKRYTLFLDESETHKHNKVTHSDSDYHFCMAGVIVAEDDYAYLQNSVDQLKRNVWPELSNPENVILHQMRLIEAEKGRLEAESNLADMEPASVPELLEINSCSINFLV